MPDEEREDTPEASTEEPPAHGDDDEAEFGEEGEDEPRPAGLIGFILVPAVLVIIAAGIFYGIWYVVGDRNSIDDYKEMLHDPNPNVRWQAMLELVQRKRASPELIPILTEIVQSPDKEQILEHKVWSDDPRVWKDWLKTEEERQINLRWFATRVLGTIGGPDVMAMLLGLAGDEDNGVRLYAAEGLANSSSAMIADRLIDLGTKRAMVEGRVIPRLIELLEIDADWGVRVGSAWALGEIGATDLTIIRLSDGEITPVLQPETLQAMVAVLTKSYEEVDEVDLRRHSAIALARLGDATGQTVLDEMLESDDPAIRKLARQALHALETAAATTD